MTSILWRAQGGDDLVGVAGLDGLGHRRDASAEAMYAAQHDDGGKVGSDDVAEHGARLDRGQLAGIADEE